MWQHTAQGKTIRKIARVLVRYGVDPAEVEEFVEAMGKEAAERLAQSAQEPSVPYDDAIGGPREAKLRESAPRRRFKETIPEDLFPALEQEAFDIVGGDPGDLLGEPWLIRASAVRAFGRLAEYLGEETAYGILRRRFDSDSKSEGGGAHEGD